MKIHRFLINKKIENLNECVITNPSLCHQLNNVLRLKADDEVVLLDGQGGEFFAKIKCFTDDSVSFFDIRENLNMRSLPNLKINLVPAVLKKDKFEWVVQKCTEIGVLEFSPVVSDRTEKMNLNFERLEKIIFEAFEQSEKSVLPQIHKTEDLESVIKKFPEIEKIYLEIDAPKIYLDDLKTKKEVLVFVGPEGGWEKKINTFLQKIMLEQFL